MTETTYKGRAIKFDEKEEEWYFIDGDYDNDDTRKSAASLKELKKYIDKLDRKAFVRVPVLFRGGWDRDDDIVEGFITSVSPDGRDMWTIKKGEKHAEKNRYSLYVDNAANRSKIHEIKKLRKEEAAIEKKREKIEESLEGVDTQKLKAEFLKG